QPLLLVRGQRTRLARSEPEPAPALSKSEKSRFWCPERSTAATESLASASSARAGRPCIGRANPSLRDRARARARTYFGLGFATRSAGHTNGASASARAWTSAPIFAAPAAVRNSISAGQPPPAHRSPSAP